MSFDLQRFKDAQESDYPVALNEIKAGCKESHWIWYIFPQLKELGYSPMAKYYGLTKDEAEAYIADDVLRARLVEITAPRIHKRLICCYAIDFSVCIR